MLALGALLAGLAALVIVVLARDESHSYRFMFENAGQLVEGDLVRIGGTPAGEIESIELSDDGQAEVSVSIDDDFAPLHAGSTATIRAASLIGVANRYIDVHPGPNFRSELDDGTTRRRSSISISSSTRSTHPRARASSRSSTGSRPGTAGARLRRTSRRTTSRRRLARSPG